MKNSFFNRKMFEMSIKNKRTGINAAFIFLEKNGFSEKRIVSQDEIIDVALRVARKEMSLGDIAVWLDDIFSV